MPDTDYPLLQQIRDPSDLRRMPRGQLGALAARTYLVDRSDLAAADPQLSGLLEQQQTLEQRLQDWVGRKSELAEAAYYDGLEALLVELIPVDRALRSKEPSGQE